MIDNLKFRDETYLRPCGDPGVLLDDEGPLGHPPAELVGGVAQVVARVEELDVAVNIK